MEVNNTIWTIGHSTRSFGDFLEMLQGFGIEVLADVRSFPGSRRYPHFNQEYLQQHLPLHSMEYMHFPELGGRRKPLPGNASAWRNTAFRGYADYMETEAFKAGVERLLKVAGKRRTAYMCSEAVWWRCHRSLISDYLKARGLLVMHIMDRGKAVEHPYTQPAKVVQGKLFY